MGILTQYGADIGGIDPELIVKIGTDTLQTQAQDLSGAINELAAGGANSWRPVKVNGTQQLSTDTTSGAVDFVNGNNTTVTFNSTGNTISITADNEIISLTNQEYQNLPEAEKNNGKYYHITDRNSSDLLDTNVIQVESTTNADYEVLLSNNASTATETDGVKKSSGLKYNPSTGDLELTHGSSDIVLSGTDNYWYDTKTSLKDAVSTLNSSLTNLIKSKKVHGTTESNGNLVVSNSDIPITSKILSVIPQRQSSGYYSGMFSCTIEVNAAQTAYIINCADYTQSPPSRLNAQNVEVEIVYV